MRERVCCFTGHRKLPAHRINQIIKRLNDEVDALIRQGVTEFISGGALGFDQIAASLIIAKRQMGENVRLIFALPHRGYDEKWTTAQRNLYCGLLGGANEVRYISEAYAADCMKKRNFYMVENSKWCLCALLHKRSGTSQTVRYAREKGLKIINIADSLAVNVCYNNGYQWGV